MSLGLAFWSPFMVRSAEPVDGKMKMGDKMTDHKTMGDKMMAGCQEMMDQKEKMMSDMKAQGAELADQVSKMNNAPDDKKVPLMAGVITHMVEQQNAMNARMATMDSDMMKHMMHHMKMSPDSVSQCPMMKDMMDMSDTKDMKDMKGMGDKPSDAPKEVK
jgi:hypothetical protein